MELSVQDAFAHVNILYILELEFGNLYGIGKIEPKYVIVDKISICEFLACVNIWFSVWLIL